MNATQRRTERDHVHVGILLREEAAFEAGVDSQHLRIFMEDVAVCFGQHTHRLRIRIRVPAGIAVRVHHIGTDHPEGGGNLIDNGTFLRFHGAALAGGEHYLAIHNLHGCQVGGSLHKARNVLRHGGHAVRANHESVQHIDLEGFLQDLFHGSGGFHSNRHAGVGGMELGLVSLVHFGKISFPSFNFVFRHGHDGKAFAGNSVAQVAGIDVCHAQVVVAVRVPEDAGEEFHGVSATFVDVVTAMTALQTFNLDFKEFAVALNRLIINGDLGHSVLSAGTTNEELAFILRIEVEEHLALHKAGFHSSGTGKAGLFVNGEEALDGTVFQLVVVENG